MKKYSIFPKRAIYTFIVLLMIGMVMLKIIDENMPQYGSWTIENRFINADRKIKMKAIKNRKYPLIDLKSSNLSQNENKKKIMIIGDSYIEGDGYSNLNQTWWRQLELELHDRGYYDVEVYGVGRDGASTQDEKNWLVNTPLVEETNPDILIFGYVINDPQMRDEQGNYIVKKFNPSVNYFEKNKLLQTFQNYFPNIAYKINNMLQQKHEQETEYNDETGYPEGILADVIINEKNSQIYQEKAVQPLGEYLNSIQIPSFVVTTPNGKNPKPERYQILSLFEEAGIKTYNMYSAFRKYQKKPKIGENTNINYVNGHPGTAYTKFYAQYVADILEKDYKEVLGNKYEEKIEYPICINDWVPYSLNAQAVNEETDEVTYKITMPSKDNMLYMPIKETYIKLSLEYPVSIKEIQLKGEKLKEANLYITAINDTLGYDDQTLKWIEKKKGSYEGFTLEEEELVTSICIHTNMLEGNELEITVKR